MLIDQTSELYYRRIEDNDFWQSVNSIIREAVEEISEAYQTFFLIMLENGTGVSDTLRLMGVDLEEKGRYYEMYRKGLRVIRMSIKKRIGQMHDIALEECISFHTGVGSWRNRNFTSTVEQAVIKRNDPRYTAQAIGEVLL